MVLLVVGVGCFRVVRLVALLAVGAGRCRGGRAIIIDYRRASSTDCRADVRDEAG